MNPIKVNISLNPKECLESKTEGSLFNLVNAKAGELMDEIKESIGEEKIISQSTAYQALEHSLIELVNNAWDARVNDEDHISITVTILADEKSDDVTITVTDNAKGIPPDKAGRYDWCKALTTPSEKAHTKEKSSGQHLGLSLLAFELKKNGGSLELANNTETGRGTVITLKSKLLPPSSPMFEKDHMDGENMVTQMYRAAIKKEMGGVEDDEKLVDLILQMLRCTQFGSDDDPKTKFNTERSTRYNAIMPIINGDYSSLSGKILSKWKSEWDKKWGDKKQGNESPSSPTTGNESSSSSIRGVGLFSSGSFDSSVGSPTSPGSPKTGMKKKPSLSISSPVGPKKEEEKPKV